MKWLIPLMVMMSAPCFAMLTTGAKCPTEFQGKVKEIIPSVGPSSAFSTMKVIFVKDGEDDSDPVIVDVLENGPFEIERDKDYHVETRSGRVCKIEQI